jgi:hypothetical protein
MWLDPLEAYRVFHRPSVSHKEARDGKQSLSLASVFFKWLVEEGEIKINSIERMKPPGYQKLRRISSERTSSKLYCSSVTKGMTLSPGGMRC